MNDSPIHIRLKQDRFVSELQQAMLSILVSADIIKRILKGNPEGYCRKDIIERMLEKAPDVTRLIDGLVSEKLAERISSETDKRMSLTKITEKGINLLTELHEPMQAFSKEMDGMFSKKDLISIIELCGRIITHEMKAEGEQS
jgi:DNA-binding MarR family transcriptional regulator